MQDSITKALLFVIALSTSIIAVELIPQNRLDREKLACLDFYEKLQDDRPLELFKETDKVGIKEPSIYCKYI